MSHNKEIGSVGEGIACRFLMKRGFNVLQRNYLKKCGEIDIVCKKGDLLHFVEVKTVSRENIKDYVNRETSSFRPEDNVHPWKLERMSRVIQTYLIENNVSDETDWKFDVVNVYLDVKNREAKVEILEDIILG